MKIRIWIISLTITLLLAGCKAPTATSLPPTTNSPQLATVAPLSPTNTPVVVIATEIPRPTKPPTVVTPMFTLRPTLSNEEAKTLILDLMHQHENCRLPCLWGFIPGKSNVGDAIEFVETFGVGDFIDDIELSAHNYDSGIGSVSISYPKNDVIFVIHWAYYQGKDTTHLELLTLDLSTITTTSSIDASIQQPIQMLFANPTYKQEFQDYSISSVLTIYGQPSQVLVMTQANANYEDAANGWYPFSLILVYPEQGFLVEYVSPREITDNKFEGCPDRAQVHLVVWSVEDNFDWKREITDRAILEGRLRDSKPLEQATALTLDKFYQVYKRPDTITCLETPMDLWLP